MEEKKTACHLNVSKISQNYGTEISMSLDHSHYIIYFTYFFLVKWKALYFTKLFLKRVLLVFSIKIGQPQIANHDFLLFLVSTIQIKRVENQSALV